MLKLPVSSGATHFLVLKLPVPSGATHFFGVEAASSIWCNTFLGVEAASILWCNIFLGVEAASSIWCNTFLGVEAASILWCNTPFGVETAGSYPGAARLQQALPLLSSFYTRVESLPILGLGLSTAISLLTHDASCSVLCVKPGQHFQSSSSLKLPAHPLVQRFSG